MGNLPWYAQLIIFVVVVVVLVWLGKQLGVI